MMEVADGEGLLEIFANAKSSRDRYIDGVQLD
jgi:hypothetical protein